MWLSIYLTEPDIAVGREQEPGPCPDREGGELEVHRQPTALRPEPGGGGHRPVPGPQDRDRHHNSEARWAAR